MVKCLRREEINPIKWDDCVRKASNARLYAMSHYLDLVCIRGGWLALVYKDYEAVMPLALNEKIPLFPRIIHPLFAQQLGVFGPSPRNEDLTNLFIDAIPKKYKSVYLQFNEENQIPQSRLEKSTQRNNYTLDLNKPYDILHQGYSKNMKRNIKKGKNSGCQVAPVPPETFTEFYLSQTSGKTIEEHQLKTLLPSLLNELAARKDAKIVGANDEDGQLLAACLITNFNRRLTYLLARSTTQGKEKRAMHFLIDSIIKEFAGGEYILDFEGSDIDSIAEFYSYFGASPQTYSSLSYKSFPFNLF